MEQQKHVCSAAPDHVYYCKSKEEVMEVSFTDDEDALKIDNDGEESPFSWDLLVLDNFAFLTQPEYSPSKSHDRENLDIVEQLATQTEPPSLPIVYVRNGFWQKK